MIESSGPTLFVLEPAEFLGKPSHPVRGRPTRVAVKAAEAAVEPFVPSRKLPVGHPLIKKRRAKPDQHFVHHGVGVDTGGLEQHVALPHGGRWRLPVYGRQVADAVATEPPKSLKRKPFPVVVGPGLDRVLRRNGFNSSAKLSESGSSRGAVLAVAPLPARRSRITHRRVSAISRERTADDTSLRTRRRAFASATYQTSSSVGPDRNGYWSIASQRLSRVAESKESPRPPRSRGLPRVPLAVPKSGSAPAPMRPDTGPPTDTDGNRKSGPLSSPLRETADPRTHAACCDE